MLHACHVTAQDVWLAAYSLWGKQWVLLTLQYINVELLSYRNGLSVPCSAGIPVWISWFKYLSFIFYGESA